MQKYKNHEQLHSNFVTQILNFLGAHPRSNKKLQYAEAYHDHSNNHIQHFYGCHKHKTWSNFWFLKVMFLSTTQLILKSMGNSLSLLSSN
jgi:hypothetical protein